VGGTTILQVNVTNPNSNTALTGVAFTDTFPPGLVATITGPLDLCGGTGTVTAGSLSMSGMQVNVNTACGFNIAVKGTQLGKLTNTTSTVTSTNGGTGNSATASLNVGTPPTIAKSFSPASVPAGGTSTLTFTLTNPNQNDALTGVNFADTLPAGLVVATPNAVGGTCPSSISNNFGATAGSSTVALTSSPMTANQSCTLTVNVTPTSVGVKNNSVTLNDSQFGTDNTATASLTAGTPPTIAKSFSPASVPLGGVSTLTFTLTNPNQNNGLTGVNFTDTLPAGLVVATPNGVGGTCPSSISNNFGATAGSSSVQLTSSPMTANQSCTLTVNVTPTSSGLDDNSVTLNDSQFGTDNTATASLNVIAPPTIAKSFSRSSIPFGGSTPLSFTIDNPNASDQLTGVGFTDNLPAGLVVATPSNGLTGSCGGGTITANPDASSISLTGATLAGGSSCTFSVNVIGITPGLDFKNTTSPVTSTEGGSGNTAVDGIEILGCPASQPFPHLLTAHTNVGTILGGFCVNSFGIGTYTQGSVSGMGFARQVFGATQISAVGTNLNLAGNAFGTANAFTEQAPTAAMGTFSLS
jgi:uncharacterized repeat protein (TIGR01451 family)